MSKSVSQNHWLPRRNAFHPHQKKWLVLISVRPARGGKTISTVISFRASQEISAKFKAVPKIQSFVETVNVCKDCRGKLFSDVQLKRAGDSKSNGQVSFRLKSKHVPYDGLMSIRKASEAFVPVSHNGSRN